MIHPVLDLRIEAAGVEGTAGKGGAAGAESQARAVSGSQLADALIEECDLLSELYGILGRLREAMAVSDDDLVDASTTRQCAVVHSLQQAMERRRNLFRMRTGGANVALGDLEEVLGQGLMLQVAGARERHWYECERVAGQLESARGILRDLRARPAERKSRTGSLYGASQVPPHHADNPSPNGRSHLPDADPSREFVPDGVVGRCRDADR